LATEFERYWAHGNRDNPHGTVSLIIPVKDAEKYVDKMVRYVRRTWNNSWGSLEIIIVDDHSIDKTCTLADTEADILIPMKRSSGKGGCIRAGMEKARGDYRLVIEPKRIKEIDRAAIFIEWLRSGVDVVIGNRFSSSNQKGYRGNLPALLARRISDASFAPGVSDTRSGFFGFNRHAGKRLYENSFINGLGNDSEIIGIAMRQGLKIREVPLTDPESPPVREMLKTSTAIGLIADSIRFKSHWGKKVKSSRTMLK
jgi:glycosyltransferase involved in cell wall biosynthesis